MAGLGLWLVTMSGRYGGPQPVHQSKLCGHLLKFNITALLWSGALKLHDLDNEVLNDDGLTLHAIRVA